MKRKIDLWYDEETGVVTASNALTGEALEIGTGFLMDALWCRKALPEEEQKMLEALARNMMNKKEN